MNDPCDELSDGLTGILLKDVLFNRMTPKQRRHININALYGKFGNELRACDEYARLVRPSLCKLFDIEYPRDPSVTITPKPGGIHHVKYDNPISPRTWTLDAS